MEKPSFLFKLKAAISNNIVPKKDKAAGKRLTLPDSSSEPYDEEFKKSFTNRFAQFVPADLHQQILKEVPIEKGFREIAEGFYISNNDFLNFRSTKIEKSLSFHLEFPRCLPKEKELGILTSGDYIVSTPFLKPTQLQIKTKENGIPFDLFTRIECDLKEVENIAVGPDPLPFIFCILFTSHPGECAQRYAIFDLAKKDVVFQKELDVWESDKFSGSTLDQPRHTINPHYLFYKYLAIDEPNAGLLTQKALGFVNKKNRAVQDGIKILQKFHDPRYIKNKYRLVKFTKPPHDPCIYEKVHTLVKHLSNLKLSDHQQVVLKKIIADQNFKESQDKLRQNKKPSILD